MNAEATAFKIRRLRRGARARVLDLFSGCGGLSLGFARAGALISAGVEQDSDAAASHAANFHNGALLHRRARDITRTAPEALIGELGLGDPACAIDILVGGPPCQAFARVGRPKLREIYEHKQAFRRDPRALLYLEYLHYVDALAPLALLMENVPDALNHGGQNIAQEIAGALAERGYVCGYTLLNAAFYGVPQMRERMFLIAYRREAGLDVAFPAPGRFTQLPPGYDGSRAVAMKHLNGLFRSAHDFIDTPAPDAALPAAVTVREAIGDLPVIDARHELKTGRLKRGVRRLDELAPWDRRRRPSQWAAIMRSWPGFEADPDGVRGHVIRYLPRDYAIFARMKPGDQYPEALALAEAMFARALGARRRAGAPTREGSHAWQELRASIVPPYDGEKFPNKWRKLDPDEPARTLMAHLGKDSYSHIHYDSRQARTISVREAARLQSFPDGFIFCGAMNSAFRQIGNAVPPLMAAALAEDMLAALRGARHSRRRAA